MKLLIAVLIAVWTLAAEDKPPKPLSDKEKASVARLRIEELEARVAALQSQVQALNATIPMVRFSAAHEAIYRAWQSELERLKKKHKAENCTLDSDQSWVCSKPQKVLPPAEPVVP